MTIKNAINIFLSKRPKAREIIKIIVNWNQALTVAENEEFMGISKGSAYAIARKYGLKYAKGIITGRPIKPLYRKEG